MTNQISTQTVSFNNQSLITIEQNGVHYVAMKPICENIGLAWEPQVLRIKRDEVLSQGMIVMIMVAEDGKKREMICLPIEYLNGWLFGIDINRCKPEIRGTLIKYKKECYQALHDYWFNGKAERKTTVDDRTGLRNAVNMLVSKKGLIYSEAYHLIHQRFNVESIEDLTLEQLPEAVEYVHRIILEGELITEAELPNREKKYTREFTEHDLQQLVWAWFALLRGTELCQVLHPALKQIGSHYAASVYSMAYEYRSTLRHAHNVLTRITEQFECEQGNNWRVLKHLRAYNPKATGFQLDIL
ncbi:antirepressor [Haemophilus influenzae biotype aegyptius]|uniref:phage antirepressor N-terminal domain-containing protein n=1 Tax=Haemophilus influenzae TaxID=727 RepID=UPI00110A6A3E|nr:phage antirepressor N-terminal domain-containing protein [Haemophilus influenzae]TMQ42880.1 antirepressor [Haemophilus influenzae biotype aegyptius]